MFPRSKPVPSQTNARITEPSSGFSGLLTNALTRNGGSAGPGLRDALNNLMQKAAAPESVPLPEPPSEFTRGIIERNYGTAGQRPRPNSWDDEWVPWDKNDIENYDDATTTGRRVFPRLSERYRVFDMNTGKSWEGADILDHDRFPDGGNGVPDKFDRARIGVESNPDFTGRFIYPYHDDHLF